MKEPFGTANLSRLAILTSWIQGGTKKVKSKLEVCLSLAITLKPHHHFRSECSGFEHSGSPRLRPSASLLNETLWAGSDKHFKQARPQSEESENVDPSDLL